MGWEIHITRVEHWTDSADNPISADSRLALVNTDPELQIDVRDNGPYFALWLSHSIENDHPWFDWNKGAIFTSRPDRKILGKALAIAKYFGAHVQGDDGEEYKRVEDLR